MPVDTTFIGFLVTALTATAGFLAWLIRDDRTDMRKQRDTAFAGWQGQIAATQKLADVVETLQHELTRR